MKSLFKKTLITYAIGIFILISIVGAVLSLVITNYIVLIAVLLITYIIFMIVLLQLFEKYIKPIEKTTKVVNELVEGNYRARIHHPSNGNIGELSHQLNKLARNLSKLSVQEQIQSEQLSTVIDNTESGLVLIDEKGYIHLVNRTFTSIFGKTSKDYIGHLYYEVMKNEKIHTTVQDTFLYEKNVRRSFTHTKEIDRRYLQIVGAPIFDYKNRLKGALLVLYDITELKNLELMRKDFVANVSHELKTPITSIRGFAETLVDSPLDDQESLKKFLGIIYEESKRMQLLVDDLLILSRLEQDEYDWPLETVHIKDILKDVTPIINRHAEKHDVRFTAEVDETAVLLANKEKMSQLLINLLANAVSYTPEKGSVVLKVDTAEDHIQVQVKDTGIGIDQKFIPRIFERFYRVDKARSRNTGGTGLGLAIVKHIVEVHNGHITVNSELDKGTTFTIKIPKSE